MIRRRVCNVDRARGRAKFASGVIVGAILSCSSGFAAGARHNGSYWSGLPQLARMTYIEGYADAMQTSIGKLQSLGVAADLLHWKGSKKILAQVARELKISGRSAKDLMHYVDKVYSESLCAIRDGHESGPAVRSASLLEDAVYGETLSGFPQG